MCSCWHVLCCLQLSVQRRHEMLRMKVLKVPHFKIAPCLNRLRTLPERLTSLGIMGLNRFHQGSGWLAAKLSNKKKLRFNIFIRHGNWHIHWAQHAAVIVSVTLPTLNGNIKKPSTRGAQWFQVGQHLERSIASKRPSGYGEKRGNAEIILLMCFLG